MFYDDYYQEALEVADIGLSKAETAKLYKIKGNILFELGRCNEAIEAMKKEISMDPSDQILVGGLRSFEYITTECNKLN